MFHFDKLSNPFTYVSKSIYVSRLICVSTSIYVSKTMYVPISIYVSTYIFVLKTLSYQAATTDQNSP